jgi:murein DD-endopeptidase MepM/ murein hydrolase activator NlpD
MERILIILIPLLLNVFAFCYHPEKIEKRQDNIYPVRDVRISSGFGKRKGSFHWGIDFSAPYGTPIISPIDMKIFKVGRNENHGLYIIGKDYDNFYYLFAHLSKVDFNESKEIKQGEVIGYIGNTGLSFGPHLHYEISFNGVNFNPTNFTKKNFKIRHLEDEFY